MHSPTAVRMMVDPIDSPARAETPMCPTMAVSMSTKVGSAMSWPNVGRASASMRPYAARLPVRAVPAVAGSDDCGSGVCTCTL